MKVLVCGGRDYDDWPKLKEALDQFHEVTPITEIIHGGAQGADRLSGVWARWNNIKETVFPANWKEHGKAAGVIRNQQMLDEGKPDRVMAFKGGKGTENMKKLTVARGVNLECL